MIIGVLGNVTVIIYTILLCKEKTATSYLIANLALADLLVCLTFYPLWIIEFIQTILNIESDQDLFCKLSRSTIWSLLFSSMATILLITVDRYLYIVKPLKYPMTVTRRRVFLAISGVWLTACCLYVVLHVDYRRFNEKNRSLCTLTDSVKYSTEALIYITLASIFILNFLILRLAQIQRKRIFDEAKIVSASNHNEQSGSMRVVFRLFQAFKEAKTFSFVITVLAICCFTPTIIGSLLKKFCSASCQQMWYVVVQYEFYGINSIVNAFIYGVRHIKYRKAYRGIILKILDCNCH
ncbi:alpha-1A adrenergic receptor-like [Dendronephthya gigantea]|uniref:alpha-1A adrenergic receptor-like n=1 Tax=Dendronephthya gigantea TaxID=151771 RepID=UPI00106C0E75|nr:alpha-1A adrenergic receptor-like [Dendronephthya gigantea]